MIDLSKKHTKVLLQWLASARRCGGSFDVCDNGGMPDTSVSIEQLKEELAKREHVPNKIEAKKIRQQKAKAKRS